MNINIHFDGSCWPNPGGLARYGFTVKSFGGELNYRYYGLVGEGPKMSNNHAEFYAMCCALEYALKFAKGHKVDCVNVFGDSEVAIRLMTGRYRANPDKLYYPAFVQCKSVQGAIEDLGVDVRFDWCPREENQECDDLSKMPVNTATPELCEEADGILADLLADDSLLSTTCGSPPESGDHPK